MNDTAFGHSLIKNELFCFLKNTYRNAKYLVPKEILDRTRIAI